MSVQGRDGGGACAERCGEGDKGGASGLCENGRELDPARKDLGLGLYASFVLFGMAQLLPWNVYMKSVPYFRTCLAGSALASSVPSCMSTCFTLFNFLAMVLLVIFRYDELFFGTCTRVIIGMTGNALLMLLMAGLTFLRLSNVTLFVSVLVITAVAGTLTACLMKGLLAVTARFPPRFTPALLGGQAAAGLLVSFASAISTSSKQQSVEASGPILYFAIGSAVLALALAAFLTNSLRSPKFRHYMGFNASEDGEKITHPQRTSYASMWAVFSRIKWLAWGVALTLAVTVSLFATFITAPRFSLPKTPIADATDYFLLLYVPVIFILYDLGDVIGRWIPAVPGLASHPKSPLLTALPWVRLILFSPLFLFIAPVNPTGHSPFSPTHLLPFGVRDFVYALTTFTFGITNGYCCTTLLMHAPALASCEPMLLQAPESATVSDGKERETCGALMGLFLNTGLVLGSLSTFIWRLFL